MGKRIALFVLFSIVALAVSSNVYAQQKASAEPDSKSYLVVKGGVFCPQGDLSDLNTGFNGELAYGYRFLPNAAVELSSGYFQASKTFRESVSGFSASVDEKVYAIPLTVAIKGIVPIDKFELYGLAGTGVYFVDGKATASVLNVSASFSDNTAVWGGFLGAGASYNITPQFFVGLEGKYLWTSSAKLHDTVQGVYVNADFKIRGFLGTANVGFRF